jgi:hypothetical protein
MKKIGLLFTPENRALVRAGLKSQTRRGMKLQPSVTLVFGRELAPGVDPYFRVSWGNFLNNKPCFSGNVENFPEFAAKYCPYGNPHVEPCTYYLKEPVRITALWDSRESNTEHGMAMIQYTDDIPDDIIECQQHKVKLAPGDMHKLVSRKDWHKPSSSMFMLQSFARTWLPCVRTWPERLGDMSAADAIAEGIELDPDCNRGDGWALMNWADHAVWRDYLSGGYDLTPVQSYASLWESINGKGSWNPDKWVWCVEWQSPTGEGVES